MSEKKPTTKAENERQYHVTDQMLTMHSSFRDRLERRAFVLNTGLVAVSLFLTVMAFVGDDLLQALGFDPTMTRFVLGLAAVVALVFSITEFRVNWHSIAGRHAEATLRLATLKAKYRRSFAQTAGDDPRMNAKLTVEYEKTMTSIPPIPDQWFNTLKAEHSYKRLLSKKINQYPKAPLWFLRLHLRIQGIREALKHGGEHHDAQ